jgi:hypothetical protein
VAPNWHPPIPLDNSPIAVHTFAMTIDRRHFGFFGFWFTGHRAAAGSV